MNFRQNQRNQQHQTVKFEHMTHKNIRRDNSNNNSTTTNKKPSSSQIVIMAQHNPVQQRQNCKVVPSLIGQPLIPIDMSSKITSYTQMNNQIIEEIKAKQKPQSSINDLYKSSKTKCDLHTIKLSDKCRKCKQILSGLHQSMKQESALANANADADANVNVNNNVNESQAISQLNPEDSSFKNGKQSITGNLNPLILNNILSCQYFKEVLLNKKFQEVIEEIVTNVNNIEAWAVGISGVPSTFFCCLYRFVLLNLDEKQISLLTKSKCAYVKIAGLLYIRYLSNPNELWKLLSPFIDDGTLFYATVDQKTKISIGSYVVNLFKDYNHYGTRLPRIPTQIEREIKMKLLMREEYDIRKKNNEKAIKNIIKGCKCKIYKETDQNMNVNELIGEVISCDENAMNVTVSINEKEIIVGLGEIELMNVKDHNKLSSDRNDNHCVEQDNKYRDKRRRMRSRSRSNSMKRNRNRNRSRSRSRSRSKGKSYHNAKYNGHHHYEKEQQYHDNSRHHHYHHRSRSKDKYHSRSNSLSPDSKHNKAFQKIIENEKKAAIARGRDYAIKPTSFKKSISVKVPGIIKKSSRSPSPLIQNIEILQIPKQQQQSSIQIEKEVPIHSREFLERQQQLKKQYQDGHSLSKANYPKKGSDYIGPDIMKLG